MYMKTLLIDYLGLDGILRSYRVYAKHADDPVVVDRLSDVDGPTLGEHDIDIGGTRVYNSDRLEIVRSSTQIREFDVSAQGEEFTYIVEHYGLAVGLSRQAEGGMYYFIGPSGFRATRLFVSDPYDQKTDDDYMRKQFTYTLKWDTEFKSQLLEMPLRSSHGTFSFRTGGVFRLEDRDGSFVDCESEESILTSVPNEPVLGDESRRPIWRDFVKLSRLMELKPNFFGIGVNLNKLIEDRDAALRNLR